MRLSGSIVLPFFDKVVKRLIRHPVDFHLERIFRCFRSFGHAFSRSCAAVPEACEIMSRKHRDSFRSICVREKLCSFVFPKNHPVGIVVQPDPPYQAVRIPVEPIDIELSGSVESVYCRNRSRLVSVICQLPLFCRPCSIRTVYDFSFGKVDGSADPVEFSFLSMVKYL